MESGPKIDRQANNFLALTPPYTDAGPAGFWVVPVPYERTTSFQQGTARGPEAVLAASHQVEYHDEELGVQSLRAGIHTAAPFTSDADPEQFVMDLTRAYASWSREGRVIALIGGEHTVAVGAVRAAKERHPDLGVLQIDAHADLRASYGGSPYSHACTARRLVETAPVVQVGVRALSSPEARFLRESHRVEAFMAHDLIQDLPGRVAEALPDTVYISLDIDGLDPSEAPGTGTPEPGGLRYREVLDVLREVTRLKTVVGMDLTEVLPCPGSAVTEVLAARLVYKMIGYTATRGGTRTPDWRLPEILED